MIEKLTDTARQRLSRGEYRHVDVSEALRTIDGYEQLFKRLTSDYEEAIQKSDEELKALQLAQAIIGAHNELVAKNSADRASLVEQAALLLRERDEARELMYADQKGYRDGVRAAQIAQREAESEATRLTELFDSSVTRVLELTEALALSERLRGKAENAASENACRVGGLTEALAAAERREKAANLDADHNGERAEAAEARVRELTEALAAAEKTIGIECRTRDEYAKQRDAEMRKVVELEEQRERNADDYGCPSNPLTRAEAAEARVRELEVSRAGVMREYGDAHAADRAALVAQLEAARELLHRVRHPVNCHDDPSNDIDVYLSDHPSQTPTHAALVTQLEAANGLLWRIRVWADGYGSALVPHGGASDSFGDGVRYCKRQVKELLSSAPPGRK